MERKAGELERGAGSVKREAYLGERRVLKEKGRVVNQKDHNKLRVFSTGLLARALQGQAKHVPDTSLIIAGHKRIPLILRL